MSSFNANVSPSNSANFYVTTDTISANNQDCYVGCTPPSTTPEATVTPSTVEIQPTKSPNQPTLPFTGADILQIAGFGLAAVVAGGVLAKRSKNKI